MHPILADKRRLGLYLLAWIPLAGLLMDLLTTTGEFSWAVSAQFIWPLTFVYAIMCLSAWYVCRYAPLGTRRVWFLIAAINPAALITSGLWTYGPAAWHAAILAIEPQYLRHRQLLFGAGVMLYYLAAAFHYVLIALQASRGAQAREMEARVAATEAELRSLKAQIDPHFLFNSLHSISALTGSDPARAREMCILLSDFFRASLRMGDRRLIPLSEELALARHFLAIQQIRFGARLRIEEHTDPDAETCLLPPLLLQPLVENAVTHGIATLIGGGTVALETRLRDSELSITIENTFDPEAPRRTRTGVGLPNVRKRVAALSADAGRVDVRESDGRFRVQLFLPAMTEETK